MVADLLCGAGGSSTGCVKALADLGLEMELVCVNHWPTAIETHTRNHPQARHYCQDIATVRPHLIVPEGYLDLLMASPTCTHHSVARGGKPTSDQQRSDPWHIITWLTELRVKRMIIENVWEFVSWGPVDVRTGKPVKSRKGEYFNAWINVIRGLGFEPEWRKLNSANYGEAQTRQRFILKARNDRRALGWAPLTHMKMPVDGSVLPFGDLKPWRPAREIIDWSIKGRSIFGRPVPLAPKTLARILAGAIKFKWPDVLLVMLVEELQRSLSRAITDSYAKRHARRAEDRRRYRFRARAYLKWMRSLRNGDIGQVAGNHRGAAPMLVTLRRNAAGRSLALPLPTVAAGGTHIGLAEPFLMKQNFRRDAQGVDQPAPTVLTQARLGLAEPLLVNMKGRSTATDVGAPAPTQTAHAGHLFLAEPFVMAPGSAGAPRAATDPLPTITTGGAGSEDPGCARPMLVEPFIATVAHGNDEGDATANSRRVRSVDDPLGSLHAGGGKYAVVEPFVLNRHGENGSDRAHAIHDPLPTADCRGAGYVVEPFVLSRHAEGAPHSVDDPVPTQVAKHSHILISPYYGSGSGETCKSAEDPLPTLTSKGRFGMVVPVTHSDTSNRARDVEADPLPTLTTANRGELAFIAAQFGEREGQAARVHDLEQPAPTICATGHVNLVEATVQYDILFRMLEPHELAAAMGFSDEETKYEFAGTKTDQIKQIGNAVSVAMMKAEVKAIMADAADLGASAPERRQKRASA
ncbi:DNA cytosine methyltransferase [Rhodopseudomonas palustris]|uniref:DNA cytosine methyltransferase n=1 Tax=Rhodopseudomonas palustris TaxID=1076 RepID=UPI003A5BD9EC